MRNLIYKVYVVKKLVVISALLLLVTACSSRYASNGENVYTKSQNGPFLVVPPPLFKGTISHFYDLSTQPRQDPAVSIMPPVIS